MSQDQENLDCLSQNKTENFFVVGIGASAGGLRALEEFFDHLPPDSGATFVVIQHLSPDFKSLMKELLERHTQMVVNRVSDGMKLEPNRIYLIPPRHNLIIKNRHLSLIEQEQNRHHPHFPIDLFFQSLGEDCHEKAVGVVLSGTGTDGTIGLQTISQNGGLCFVQSPLTAEFDGMPQSAIATGVIDQVLSAKDIAQSIYDLVQMHNFQRQKEMNLEIKIEDNILNSIIKLLNESEEIDFSSYKLTTLSRRIYRRCSLAGFNNLPDYVAYLEKNFDQISLLRNDLLIGVTRFFRDKEVWTYLETQIIPNLISSLEDKQQLRVWITACSTGEEAYSMAILIHEAIERTGKMFNVKIFATDIDNEALAKASEGIYPESIAKDISADRLVKYFTFRNQSFIISRKIRDLLIFAPHNLVKNAGFTRMNLISCRNVLIYMQPKLQQQVLRMLHFSLIVKGILFLGMAETTGEIEGEFIPLHEQYRIYQKRRNVRLPIKQSDNQIFPTSLSFPSKIERNPQYRFDPILDEAMGNFMEDRGYTCLLVNRNQELIHLISDGAKVLQMPRGRITKEITVMLPKVLQVPVSTALHRAGRNNRSVLYTGIYLEESETESRNLRVKVSYCDGNQAVDDFLMVVIETEIDPQIAEKPEKDQIEVESAQRIVELENELQQNKENLQTTIEELETTNEEQQSTNEELQNINEELYIVNTEYQSKIKDLTQWSNEINKLLCSSNIGVIFLDKELKIRKFTPSATVAINLLDTDIERPINHLTHNLDCQNLLELLQEVEQTQKVIEKEVKIKKTNDYFLMRIHPYNTNNGNYNGVVLSFIKINDQGVGIVMTELTDIKQTQQALNDSEARFRGIFEQAEMGMSILSLTGEIIQINQKFCQFFALDQSEILNKNFMEFRLEESDQSFARILEEIVKGEKAYFKEEKCYQISDNSCRWGHLFLSLIKDEEKRPLYFILMLEDIEERKVAEILLEKKLEQEQKQKAELTLKNMALETIKNQVTQTNEAKNKFLANMSYEIRTPMNAILGFSELLKEKIEDSLSLSYLDSIVKSGEALLALINDILDLSKIESKKLQLHNEPINIYQFLQDIQEIFLYQIQSKKLDFISEIKTLVPKVIIFDKIRLRQILLNVVGNALKFTNQGYLKILVSSENFQESDQKELMKTCTLIIKIEDTGIGIDPQEQKDIFEAFQQVKTGIPEQYHHTGLGLTLTKSLTEILGGTVTLESQINQGSIFTFTFPNVQICEDNLLLNLETEINPDLNQFPPQTILYIDDIQSHLDLIKAYFVHSHHQLFFANNDLDAMSILEQESISLIFLDLKMPQFDSIKFIEKVSNNEKTKNIPILILSASVEYKDNKNLTDKIEEFLVKPVHRFDIIKALQKLFPSSCRINGKASSTDKIKANILDKLTPEITHKLPDLLNQLQNIKAEIWQEINQKHLISEIRQFSQSLQKLGIEYRYQPLLNYSYQLSQSLIEFDVDNITQNLHHFPELIEELKLVLDNNSV